MAKNKGKLFIRKSSEGYADREEVAEFAAELSDRFLQCREIAHTWRKWVARWDAEHNCFERALKCANCKTERWESIGQSGAKLAARYVYPDGYSHEGLGRIVGEGRDALRVESMTRDLTRLQNQAS